MTMTPSDMSALLGSRICHDLISPLGAIGNGIELLQMSGLGDSPELTLITESVENANARIRLFRVAFGAAAPGQMLSRPEVLSIVKPMGTARGIRIAWDPAGDLDRDEARLIFLLLLCGETALPRGGSISVEHRQQSTQIVIAGERIRREPSLWSHLETTDNPVPAASEIHFPLARQAADGLGRTPVVQQDETRITVTV